MKNTITRQPLSITIVIFTLLVLFFWGRHLFFPLAVEAAVANNTPFGGALNNWLTPYPYVEAALCLVFTYLSVLVVTRIVVRNLVFPARTHIFVVLFAVAGFGFYIVNGALPSVLAAYLLARACEYFTVSFRRSAHFGPVFGGALMLGLAPLLYAPSAVYVLLLPVALSVYMRRGREAMVALFGLLLPVTAYAYVMWAMGEPFLQPFADIYAAIVSPAQSIFTLDFTPAGIARLATAAVLGVILLFSLATFAAHARTMRTRAYRIYLFFVFFLLISAGSMFLPSASAANLPLAALPVCVVGSQYFSQYSGKAPTIIYMLLLAASVAANLIPMI